MMTSSVEAEVTADVGVAGRRPFSRCRRTSSVGHDLELDAEAIADVSLRGRAVCGLTFACLFLLVPAPAAWAHAALLRTSPQASVTVNGSAGARSQLSGLVVAGLTVITLLFLTGLFENLPEATLAAIVIGYALAKRDKSRTT